MIDLPQVLSTVAEATNNKYIKTNDMSYLVHPGRRKVVVALNTVSRSTIDIKMPNAKPGNHRIEAQHIMNCLAMQNIDPREPWFKTGMATHNQPSKVLNERDDSFTAICATHQALARSGLRLWKSTITTFNNSCGVLNVYIDPSKVNPDEKMDVVYFRGIVSTVDFSDVLDTEKYPTVYWDYLLSLDTGNISRAVQLGEDRDLGPISDITIGYLEPRPVGPCMDIVLPGNLHKVFDLVDIYNCAFTSDPGEVNTVKIYNGKDSYGNAVSIKLSFNNS